MLTKHRLSSRRVDLFPNPMIVWTSSSLHFRENAGRQWAFLTLACVLDNGLAGPKQSRERSSGAKARRGESQSSGWIRAMLIERRKHAATQERAPERRSCFLETPLTVRLRENKAAAEPLS
jgi:hypothetical protein